MRVGLDSVIDQMGRVHYRQRSWRTWLRMLWWLFLLPLALGCWAALQQSRPRQLVAWGLAAVAALLWVAVATGGRQEPQTPAADTHAVEASPRPSLSAAATVTPTPSTMPSPSPATAPPSVVPSQPVSPQLDAPSVPPPDVVPPPPVVVPAPAPPRASVSPPPSAAGTTAQPPVAAFYANCTEARAAGVTPLYRGQPGYSAKLDRDGDGTACE